MPEPPKKPVLAESLQGLRDRCRELQPWLEDPESTWVAVDRLKDILDDLLMLLQDDALQSANAEKPQATKTAPKSAKPKTNQ